MLLMIRNDKDTYITCNKRASNFARGKVRDARTYCVEPCNDFSCFYKKMLNEIIAENRTLTPDI
jgi:hypothetical protein